MPNIPETVEAFLGQLPLDQYGPLAHLILGLMVLLRDFHKLNPKFYLLQMNIFIMVKE